MSTKISNPKKSPSIRPTASKVSTQTRARRSPTTATRAQKNRYEVRQTSTKKPSTAAKKSGVQRSISAALKQATPTDPARQLLTRSVNTKAQTLLDPKASTETRQDILKEYLQGTRRPTSLGRSAPVPPPAWDSLAPELQDAIVTTVGSGGEFEDFRGRLEELLL